MPVNAEHGAMASPIFNYPYARSRETLEAMKRGGDPDACHGWKLRYANPVDGGYAMPTIATFIQLLPKGSTTPYRSTDATVFVGVEGRGTSRIGDVEITWGPRDVFVAPSWKPVVHSVEEESVMFSFSDRVVQEKLGLWRESRGNA